MVPIGKETVQTIVKLLEKRKDTGGFDQFHAMLDPLLKSDINDFMDMAFKMGILNDPDKIKSRFIFSMSAEFVLERLLGGMSKKYHKILDELEKHGNIEEGPDKFTAPSAQTAKGTSKRTIRAIRLFKAKNREDIRQIRYSKIDDKKKIEKIGKKGKRMLWSQIVQRVLSRRATETAMKYYFKPLVSD